MPTELELNLLRRFNVGDILRRSALRFPERPAFVYGDRTVTYAELDLLASRVANLLLQNGLRQGDVVAVLDRPDPIGRPHLPLEIRLVDAGDRPVPPGEVGEIAVRGPAVMAGYFEDAERTEAAFRGGWHHTGDLAVAGPDGFLYFVDRLKDIVKTGGENVSSQEVEEVIARHPAVAEVSVIGIPDPYWAEAVAAVVVPRGAVTEEEIVAHCRAHLAPFKVPKRVFFAGDLPRSPSGKILKRELRQRYREEVRMGEA